MSKYFTMKELTHSNTAIKHGIDNMPCETVKKNLDFLANKTLDPIREFLGRPVRLSNAYRSKELNAKVGGVVNSVHTMGLAADLIIPTEKEMDKLLDWLIDNDVPFGQAIKYPKRGFVHVGLNPAGRNRRTRMISPSKNKYIPYNG